jgi:hypothetical protein
MDGLNSATPFTIGIRSYKGFEGFVIGPYCSVKNLEGSFMSFGCKRWEP